MEPCRLAAAALGIAIAGTVAYDVSRVATSLPSPSILRAVASTSPSTSRPLGPHPAPVTTPERAWTRAAVATVWLRPGTVRRVDRPALRRRPDISRWMSAQTVTQRSHLDRRVLTQAVHGEPVRVLDRRPGWSKVLLPEQRGSYYRDGIIGWVPSRQLASRPTGGPTTRLPRTPATVLRLARGYLGTDYLWGGMTRRGIDCSGLTYRVFRQVGVTLPRDAADQSRRGRPVVRRALQPGDLVFFGPGGWRTIHHVGIYVGDGLVLHAPYTGTRVRLTPLSAWTDYWGARRYV